MQGLVAVFLLSMCSIALAADYYELLGVSRNADLRELRRAFKKLALEKHPDKNPDNPAAHEEFVKINTAFEILKDPELRKKYDTYGEEGLKEGFNGGQQYDSWQHYKEDFGLYDDDPQIETIPDADFQDLVMQSEDRWFVNFYSTGCSHCHELAPSWREFGKEMQGMIGVAAVNCREQWSICQNVGIRMFPTLIFFQSKNRFSQYQGARDVESLKRYVFGFFGEIRDLNTAALPSQVADAHQLIVVCVPEEPCPGSQEVKGVCRISHKASHTTTLFILCFPACHARRKGDERLRAPLQSRSTVLPPASALSLSCAPVQKRRGLDRERNFPW
eukprot:m.314809 g.314809  ORF g.314809 m.314809 type:complete len:331 (-) comp55423_c0_seq1:4445-5437(-)